MSIFRLTISDILKSYEFSHKFYVKYALFCAKYAISFDKEPHPDSLNAISLVEQWLLDSNSVSDKDLADAANAVFYAASAHAAANNAANAAAYAAAHAADFNISKSKAEAYLKKSLIKMIKEEHCKLELIMLGLDEMEVL